MRTPSETPRALLLGRAAAKITPPPGVALSGFVARTEPMAGVHDDLYARALVWSERQPSPADAVGLMCLDLIGLDAGLVATIRHRAARRAGAAPARPAVTATHTHSGPAVMLGARLGVVDQAYRASLIEAAAGAVAAAVGDLQPARGWYGLAQESTVGKNRRVPGGLIDPDVPVLRFDDAGGRVRALLVSDACHPVTLGPDNRLISADYPGSVARTLDAAYPGALAVFLTGCCGQINTGHSTHDSLRRVGLGRRSFAEAERLGRLLAGAALQAAEHAAPPGGEPVAALDAGPPASTVRAARRLVDLPLLPAEPPDALRQQPAGVPALPLAWGGRTQRPLPDRAHVQPPVLQHLDHLGHPAGSILAQVWSVGGPAATAVPHDPQNRAPLCSTTPHRLHAGLVFGRSGADGPG